MSFQSDIFPPEVTRDWDTEKLIRYSSLSPSLQARFAEIEAMIGKFDTEMQHQINDKRITFSNTPPASPVDFADLWVDTTYKALRVFAEKNWEFTRAAWYAGDNANAYSPVTDEPVVPPITPAVPTPTVQTLNLFTYSSTGLINYDNGLPDYSVGTGTSTTLRVTITGTVTGGTAGYVGIVYYPAGNEMKSGTVISYPITGPASYTIAIPNEYSVVADIDTKNHEFECWYPVNFDPNTDPNYGSLVQINIPDAYTKAEIDAAMVSGNLPVKPRTYTGVMTNVVVSVSLTTTLLYT